MNKCSDIWMDNLLVIHPVNRANVSATTKATITLILSNFGI